MRKVITSKKRENNSKKAILLGSLVGSGLGVRKGIKKARKEYNPKAMRIEVPIREGSLVYKEIFPNRIKNIKRSLRFGATGAVIGGSTTYLANKILNKLKNKNKK